MYSKKHSVLGKIFVFVLHFIKSHRNQKYIRRFLFNLEKAKTFMFSVRSKVHAIRLFLEKKKGWNCKIFQFYCIAYTKII